eukprot:GFYU01027182.1.p1 GENE.GFYU01027182.1~~GFYU01027182.1.p1  ORF type:complete len:121 (-),score=7.96 GFYU01027182.1:15-377(-)
MDNPRKRKHKTPRELKAELARKRQATKEGTTVSPRLAARKAAEARAGIEQPSTEKGNETARQPLVRKSTESDLSKILGRSAPGSLVETEPVAAEELTRTNSLPQPFAKSTFRPTQAQHSE